MVERTNLQHSIGIGNSTTQQKPAAAKPMPAPHDYKSNRCGNSVRVDAPDMVVKVCADGDADVTPHRATQAFIS